MLGVESRTPFDCDSAPIVRRDLLGRDPDRARTPEKPWYS